MTSRRSEKLSPADFAEAHILIIDDEPLHVSITERILKEAGYGNLMGVSDPRQALARFCEFAPDLVLLDLRMPHLDGFRLLRHLRTQAAADPDLPVIIITSDWTPEARQRALLDGATEFLTWPLDPFELLVRVAGLLATRQRMLALRQRNQELEALVAERTRALQAAGEGSRQAEAARQKAEAALHGSEERLKTLVSSMEELIFEFDETGQFISFWTADDDLRAQLHEEFDGRSFDEVFGRNTGLNFHAAVQRVLNTGRPETVEHCLELSRGKRWFLSRIAPIAHPHGGEHTVYFLARDITERKRAEEELRAAKTGAEEANSAKTFFLSRMSHELRTPLNAILGFTQLLDRERLSQADQDGVEQIMRSGEHLLTLINEVLDMARIESGRLTLMLEPVSAGEVLAEAMDLVRPAANLRGVKLPAVECPEIMVADRERLRQVLAKFLANAIHHSRRGDQLQIATQRQEDSLRLAVSDHGPGIRADRLETIFKPFARMEAHQAPLFGIGLGLAISRRVIELMGGEVGVENQVAQGSTFWLTLPLAGSESAPPTIYDFYSDAGTDFFAPAKVLYIEDNLSNLKLVEYMLARQQNLTLLAATQGKPGLELAFRHHPSLILLDLYLPDISGKEVLAKLRSNPRTAKIPVVVISSDSEAINDPQLLHGGIQGFLTKPLDLHDFTMALRAVLPARIAPGAAEVPHTPH